MSLRVSLVHPQKMDRLIYDECIIAIRYMPELATSRS
jgi:hypothetical protein